MLPPSLWLATISAATQCAGGVLLVLILLSGFCIMRPSIPGWWIWMYWANPMS